MLFDRISASRRLLVPETIQSSMMDCGPAALKSILGGFKFDVSYSFLRKACETSVDGTSINAVEEIALGLGIAAEQILIPPEYVLLSAATAMPSVVVVNEHGFTHFVVAWRRDLGYVQVMDPAVGRRWIRVDDFARMLHIHSLQAPASDWYEWAVSAEGLHCLKELMRILGVNDDVAGDLIEQAVREGTWRSMSALLAAVRMVRTLVNNGAISKGPQATQLLEAGFGEMMAQGFDQQNVVPEEYWPALPAQDKPDSPPMLVVRGAVLVRVREGAPQIIEPATVSDESQAASSTEVAPKRQANSIAAVFNQIRQEGLLRPVLLIPAIVISAGAIIFEAVLFRSLLELPHHLTIVDQRVAAVGLVVVFLLLALLLDFSIATERLRIGRHLESRLRIALLQKIVRLDPGFLRSRLVADVADRAHNIHTLRHFPDEVGLLFRSICELAFTTAAIIWLKPDSAPIAATIALGSVALPFCVQRFLVERDLRVRQHAAALGHFYLDSLRGMIPIRTHGAESAVRQSHERLLIEWARAGVGLLRMAVAVDSFEYAAAAGFAVWLLLHSINWADQTSNTSLLLLVYWALNLPAIGQAIALHARQYPAYRNIAARLMEPLEEPDAQPETPAEFAIHQNGSELPRPSAGLSIALQDVSLRFGGSDILKRINLRIGGGSHVAIIGTSGAGKSSLVRLLIGLNEPSEGAILVDNQKLDLSRIGHIREQTAWVDPSIQLWNRSLLDNLMYGSSPEHRLPLGEVVEKAQLREILEAVGEGLQTRIGESGSLVSGGEGQRVRLARAMMRPEARLVILDEPFSGLDRARRSELLLIARKLWRNATMLYVTHEVREAAAFDRVLVMSEGQIVEDDRPEALAARPNSRYRNLLHSEETIQELFASRHAWRHARIEKGHVFEDRGDVDASRLGPVDLPPLDQQRSMPPVTGQRGVATDD